MLTEILMGGLNALDLVPSMLRDVAGGSNPFDQLKTPFSQDNRLSGRDVLQNWGAVGENTEGLDWGDVGGFALDMALDPFLLGAPLKAMSKGGRLASQMGDTAVHAAKPHGLDIRSLLMGGAPAAGEAYAVNLAAGLPGEVPAMSPWQAMAFNRRSRRMIDEGAMPAAVARETKARVFDPDLYDTLRADQKGDYQATWAGSQDSLGIPEESFVPAQLYHGSPAGDLSRGDIDLIATQPNNMFGRGFYTSTRPEVADAYAQMNALSRPTFHFNDDILRRNLKEAIEGQGLTINKDTAGGDVLERFLAGERADPELIMEDIIEYPESLFTNSDVNTEPMIDAARMSSVIDSHDPQVVQKWMMDSRNPLDMYDVIDVPEGGRRGFYEDIFDRAFPDHPQSVKDEFLGRFGVEDSMREIDGEALYDALKFVDPKNTHEAFRNLGYDSLTHAGDYFRNGVDRHRVFIGLDPEKMYKGHAIAPDEIDVWTLRNILAGTPTVQAPIRALGAEM